MLTIKLEALLPALAQMQAQAPGQQQQLRLFAPIPADGENPT